jgi:predicted dehydrogenase
MTDQNDSVIGVGILGMGAMGRAHSSAFRRLSQVGAGTEPRLIALACRSAEKGPAFAARFGFANWVERWEDLIGDDRITLFDNTGPNGLHAEPCIAAARAGKHLFCEKPLARNAAEAYRMLEAAQAAGIVHMCGFNYRFVPAVRLAKQIIAEGNLGRILQFRARYLQSSLADPNFPFRWRSDRAQAGFGVLGDLGSHVADLARFLVGEPLRVTGSLAIFIPERPLEHAPERRLPVAVDDAFQALVEFTGGATGVLEASKVCLGSKNRLEFEANGTEGSLRFSLERLNELEVYLRADEGTSLAGFRRIEVTDAAHPFVAQWWPRHPLGWDQTFVHEITCLVEAIARGGTVAPYGATFEDGYRAAVICDAIAASAECGKPIRIEYATPGGGVS